jgi:hypothetical protein
MPGFQVHDHIVRAPVNMPKLDVCAYMYVCMFISLCVYIYVYIYTHTHTHHLLGTICCIIRDCTYTSTSVWGTCILTQLMVQDRLFSMKEAKIEQEHQLKIEQYERKIKVKFSMISRIVLRLELHFHTCNPKANKHA